MPKFVNAEAAEKWAQITYRCSMEEAVRVNGEPLSNQRSFAGRYRSQKHGAAKRGVEWAMTFPEWVAVWVASGKLGQRGRGKAGYCMARHGDMGPYSVGNVSIQTVVQNSRDGIEIARPAMRANPSHGHLRAGCGRGWTLRPVERYRKPYQVMVGPKYIGCFATQEEAESAYRAAAQRIRHEHQSVGGGR